MLPARIVAIEHVDRLLPKSPVVPQGAIAMQQGKISTPHQNTMNIIPLAVIISNVITGPTNRNITRLPKRK
jgi:hypothetical protein